MPGGRNEVVLSSQKRIHLQKGEAKDGKPCFNLAVGKLIPACPHKAGKL